MVEALGSLTRTSHDGRRLDASSPLLPSSFLGHHSRPGPYKIIVYLRSWKVGRPQKDIIWSGSEAAVCAILPFISRVKGALLVGD